MSIVGCAVAAGICLLAGWTVIRRLQHVSTTAPSGRGSELQECVAFLQEHMPERDRKTVDRKFLVHHARLALKARRANSWAAAVPWELFLNNVLPYRNLDEPIDIDWRSLFLKRFGPMVADASSLTEAAQLLNRWALAHTNTPADRLAVLSTSPLQHTRACTSTCCDYVDPCASSWKPRTCMYLLKHAHSSNLQGILCSFPEALPWPHFAPVSAYRQSRPLCLLMLLVPLPLLLQLAKQIPPGTSGRSGACTLCLTSRLRSCRQGRHWLQGMPPAQGCPSSWQMPAGRWASQHA